MLDSGIIVLSAFISPFQSDRDQVKKIVGAKNYIEVFVDTPLEVCEQRDVKGLYKKARAGEIKNFTGIDSTYEIPVSPDIIIQTHVLSVNDSLDLLLSAVEKKIALE
jgi:adenylylsulfate kinase-like enzyme